MARAARRVGAVLLVVVLAGGAYATADAYDAVPGVVTLAPVPPPPEPFPTAPAAVPAPELSTPLRALDPAIPLPDAAQVAGLVSAALSDTRMGTGVSAVVADQLTGEVLVSIGGAVPRIPASTTKLFTAAAALTTLGPERTLRTRVVPGASGQIILVGAGDMMLAAGAGNSPAVNGRAGLADLAAETARELRLTGQTSVRVGVDDSLFSGPALSPTWDPSYLRDGFTAPVTALSVNIAKVRDEEYPPRLVDPVGSAAAGFAAELGRLGITVEGSPTSALAAPDATEIAGIDSASVADIVGYMLLTSDNAIAEAVGRLVAVEVGLPGSFEGASQAIVRQVAALGVDTSGVHLVDCSGLGAGSVIPASALIDILRLSETKGDPELVGMLTGMPQSGLNGTLSDRFLSSPARGLVRAKTGSLTGVTSLAGTLVDADGRMLVFAVMADATPPGGQWGPRAVIDKLIGDLASCGCR